MNMRMTAIGLALAAASLASAPAHAQSGQQAQQQAADAQKEASKIRPSHSALKAIVELQAAVNANDVANIPAKLAAAKAAAKTDGDRYLVASFQYKAAVAAKDDAALAAALSELIASGKVDQGDLPSFNLELGRAHFRMKQYPQAAAAIERSLALQPGNGEAIELLAAAHVAQGNKPQALEMYRKMLAASAAAGGKPDQALYRKALALAYESKAPQTIELSRQWLAAYPTSQNWGDAIGIYRNLAQLDDDQRLYILRLARAKNAMKTQNDYQQLAYFALVKGYPHEAKAALDEGVAAGVVKPGHAEIKDLVAEAKTKAAQDNVSPAQARSQGLAADTAKKAQSWGELLYGMGDYAKAAEVFESALGKTGADSNEINLLLGMALARAGDSAGATAALKAAGGRWSDIAAYWLLYAGAPA